MENLLPILLIIIIFPLSFYSERLRKSILGLLLSCGLTIYFLVMAFIDRENIYFYLFPAILSLAFALRNIKQSNPLSKQH